MSGRVRPMAALCSKYSPSQLHKPLLFFFFLPRPYACLSPVLYSRVFWVMLYLTRGKMNAACVGREKWNHCTGIAVPECCNKQWICERWSGEYHFRGLGMRQWSVCAVWGLFLSVETRKTQSQSLFFVFPHTCPAGNPVKKVTYFQCHIPALIKLGMISPFQRLMV